MNQSYQNIEVIVVDKYSADGSLKNLEREPVRVVPWPSKMAGARNQGAAVSRGEFFVHIDADMELTEHVLAECVTLALEEGADAVIIPEVSAGENYWTKCLGLNKALALAMSGHEAARFYLRKAFDALGGFDPALEAGEDFDLHFRAEDKGLKIGRIKSPIIHHLGNMKFSSMVDKFHYYGQTVDEFRKKHHQRFEKGPAYPSLVLRRWRILAGDPIHAIGFFALSLIAFVAQK